jgi:transcription elongation factor GreA
MLTASRCRRRPATTEMTEPTYLTAEGLAKLQADLEHLVNVERPRIARAIGEAKSLGDITDNADYEQAKNDQAFLEGRIATLTQQLRTAELIDAGGSLEVAVGSRVKIRAEDGEELSFTIVGAPEASPREGRISNLSPLAKALLGHKAGEQIRVDTPGGLDTYQLLEIA